MKTEQQQQEIKILSLKIKRLKIMKKSIELAIKKPPKQLTYNIRRSGKLIDYAYQVRNISIEIEMIRQEPFNIGGIVSSNTILGKTTLSNNTDEFIINPDFTTKKIKQ